MTANSTRGQVADIESKRVVKHIHKTLAKTWKGEHPDWRPIPWPLVKMQELALLDDNTLFEITGQEDMVLGYMISSTGLGRYDYFDYIVITSAEYKILHIKVITYRSDHGHEITNKSWLRQFYHDENCIREYGKDIDALSGATLSGASITEGLNEICKILKALKTSNQ